MNKVYEVYQREVCWQNVSRRFIVDWDQKWLQISSDEDFTLPNFNDPVVLTDPESGRTIFGYFVKPGTESSIIIVRGPSCSCKNQIGLARKVTLFCTYQQ